MSTLDKSKPSNPDSPVDVGTAALEFNELTIEADEPRTSKRSRRKKLATEKELKLLHAKEDSSSNFMADFDPLKRRREKNTKRYTAGPAKSIKASATIYDEKGIHKQSNTDFCDCLIPDCVGCHFPCKICRGTKCAHECRQNRKYQYEFVEFEKSREKKRFNPHLSAPPSKE